jgi:hypothetical protein
MRIKKHQMSNKPDDSSETSAGSGSVYNDEDGDDDMEEDDTLGGEDEEEEDREQKSDDESDEGEEEEELVQPDVRSEDEEEEEEVDDSNDENEDEAGSEDQIEGEVETLDEMGWINDLIGGVRDKEFLEFSTDNKPFSRLSHNFAKIRAENGPTEIFERSKKTEELAAGARMENTFSRMQKISLFILHVHRRCDVEIIPGMTPTNYKCLERNMYQAMRKSRCEIENKRKRPLIFFDSVYFSKIRNHDINNSLDADGKRNQAISYLNDCANKSGELSGKSFYTKWLPDFQKDIVERLFLNKPIETDLGGLLGLIMFGGIDADETHIIPNVYPNPPPKPSNCLYDSQQNLSALLFGITYDNVRTSAVTCND